MATDVDEFEIYPHAYCGACGDRIEAGEDATTIIKHHSPARFEFRRRLKIPSEKSELYPGATLPRLLESTECEHCDPDCATLHADCFHVFMRNCNLKHRLKALWTRAQWRIPFPQSQEDGWTVDLPCLRTPASALRQKSLRQVTVDWIPESIKLPLEILYMVWDTESLQGSETRRFMAVLSLCRDLEDICHHGTWLEAESSGKVSPGVERGPSKDDERLVISRSKSIALKNISSWRRGEAPRLIEGESDRQRQATIEIDSLGIRSIDRTYKSAAKQSADRIFAWPHGHEEGSIVITFKMDFAKMTDDYAYRKFFSWNTPTPPRLDECFLPIPGGREPTYLQYAAIDTGLCTGLSFFFWCDILVAIHPHINGGRSSKDAHIETRNAVFPGKHDDVIWIFLPLSADDQITAIGVQLTRPTLHMGTPVAYYPRLLFRLARSGDIGIGSVNTDAFPGLAEITPIGPLIVHEVPEREVAAISVVGSYPATREKTTIRPLNPIGPCPVPPRRNGGIYFSAASLQNVECTRVFRNHRGDCYGILFRYSDGSRLAVGQCRIDLDTSTLCTRPYSMWKRSSTVRPAEGTSFNRENVEFQGEGDEQCERTSDWTCLPMRGVLEFWFTSQEHFIVVHERSSASEDPAGRAQPATYAVAPSDLQTNA